MNGSQEGMDLSMDLNLDLDLTLLVNHADGEYTARHTIPPIPGRKEQAAMVVAGDFHLRTLNRQDNCSAMHCVSSTMVKAEYGFERNYHEGMVGQERTFQYSATVT